MQLSEIIYSPALFVKLDLPAQQAALQEYYYYGHHCGSQQINLVTQLCAFSVTQTRTSIGYDHYIEYYNINQAFFIQVPSR